MWRWLKHSYRLWFRVVVVQIINWLLVLLVVVITVLLIDLVWYLTG